MSTGAPVLFWERGIILTDSISFVQIAKDQYPSRPLDQYASAAARHRDRKQPAWINKLNMNMFYAFGLIWEELVTFGGSQASCFHPFPVSMLS